MQSADDLLADLMAGTLDPGGFSHRDHVAAGFGALRKFEFFEAMRVYADGLRNLTVKAGVPEKFNATVTMAFMSLIAEKMHGFDDPDAMIAAHPELIAPGLMGTWFSHDRLTSDIARRVAVMPDRGVALNA
jgi:hypothetical protein